MKYLAVMYFFAGLMVGGAALASHDMRVMLWSSMTFVIFALVFAVLSLTEENKDESDTGGRLEKKE